MESLYGVESPSGNGRSGHPGHLGNGHGPSSWQPPDGQGAGKADLVHFRPLNAEQAAAWDLCRQSDVTFLTGPAGTAKTHIALAVALEALQSHSASGVVLVRPQVEAGERMGFLPGDQQEKLRPWMQAFYDVLPGLSFRSPESILGGPSPAEQAQPTAPVGGLARPQAPRPGKRPLGVEIFPLSHMRGRTFHRKVVLLDEAQNCTFKQLQMFLGRLGRQSKMIVTGDSDQCDLPVASCLEEVAGCLDGLEVQGADNVRHRIRWQRLSVCVRHPLLEAVGRRLAALCPPEHPKKESWRGTHSPSLDRR